MHLYGKEWTIRHTYFQETEMAFDLHLDVIRGQIDMI